VDSGHKTNDTLIWPDGPARRARGLDRGEVSKLDRKSRAIEDAVSRDDLLSNIMLYWATGAIGSSLWPYYARMHSPGLIPDGEKSFSQGDPSSAAIVGRARLRQYSAMDQNGKGRPFRRSGAARASREGDPRVFPSAALGGSLWPYSV
jgi:hypothetical protein